MPVNLPIVAAMLLAPGQRAQLASQFVNQVRRAAA